MDKDNNTKVATDADLLMAIARSSTDPTVKDILAQRDKAEAEKNKPVAAKAESPAQKSEAATAKAETASRK